MLFKYGEQLPVDALYISGDDISIDEAALTGEPDKLKKSEKFPFLLGGTDVVAGAGRALVVGVGENSAQGRIAVALQSRSSMCISRNFSLPCTPACTTYTQYQYNISSRRF